MRWGYSSPKRIRVSALRTHERQWLKWLSGNEDVSRYEKYLDRPILVSEGYWILDGHHRFLAAKLRGDTWILARVAQYMPNRVPRFGR